MGHSYFPLPCKLQVLSAASALRVLCLLGVFKARGVGKQSRSTTRLGNQGRTNSELRGERWRVRPKERGQQRGREWKGREGEKGEETAERGGQMRRGGEG